VWGFLFLPEEEGAGIEGAPDAFERIIERVVEWVRAQTGVIFSTG